MNVLIIDDEINAIKALRWEIEHYTPQLKVIEVFESAVAATRFIRENPQVDLVFLDIEMPEMNGFEFLKQFKKRNFEVIFTTAYSEFALEALKNEAVDYLLKPIDSDDLMKAVEKVSKRLQPSNTLNSEIQQTLNEFRKLPRDEKVKISHNGKIDFVEVGEIIYIQSEGNYSRIFMENGKEILLTCKIKELEESLPVKHFFRVHRSYIVNVFKITSFLKNENFLQINKKINIPLARSRKAEFTTKYL